MDSKKAIQQLKFLDKLAPKEMRLAAEWEKDWQVLISTILSAQTKDETTIKICEILFKEFDSPEKLRKASIKEIEKIIKPINYHKTKAKNIKATANLISKNGIPETIEELILFPGVGRKTANVFLAEYHKKAAIGVDTHVSFISQYLEWSKNKNPHKIEKDLENLFPKKYWNSVNYILVRFGRAYNRRQQKEILEKIKLKALRQKSI
jgi:endonuclease III